MEFICYGGLLELLYSLYICGNPEASALKLIL